MKLFIKYRLKKLLKGKKFSDRTKAYWQDAGKQKNIEDVMERICDKFDKKTFESKKESIIFHLNIPLSLSDTILEVGCGIGRTCKWISPKVKKYVGVDFIPEMIDKAKSYNEKFSNAEFVVNDGKTLSMFDEKTFDIVYSELAFQHMNKPIQVAYVNEIYRVLKNNGVFYVQLPRMEHYNDSTFALTKDEANNLFKDFSTTFEITEPASYFIKAQKKS